MLKTGARTCQAVEKLRLAASAVFSETSMYTSTISASEKNRFLAILVFPRKGEAVVLSAEALRTTH